MKIDKKTKQRIDHLIFTQISPDNPGCAIKVINNREVIYEQYHGLANLEHQIPITNKTVFNIGSVSKQFTATVIALLEESKKLKLSDTIDKYIPNLPDYFTKITIEDLVYMRNGIRDFYHTAQFLMGVLEDDFLNRDEVMTLLRNIHDPIFDSGTKWSYGNTGYYLLSLIVEQVTGKLLAEVAKEMIFDVLGMSCTFYRNNRNKVIPNRAYGYCKNDDLESVKHVLHTDNSELTGPGQVWTTIDDLVKWDNNIYENKLGYKDPNLIKKLTQSGKLKDGSNCNYGYGLFIRTLNDKKHLHHGGSTAGFLSAFLQIPSDHLSVIFLSNSSYAYYELSESCQMNLEFYIASLFMGNENNATQKLKVKTEDRSKLQDTKRYQCLETSSIWEVHFRDNELFISENDAISINLFRDGLDTFKSKDRTILCKLSNGNLDVIKDEKKYCFQPFIDPLKKEELLEYTGDYYCKPLDTTFVCTVENNKLSLHNKNRHRNGIDFSYEPSIKDNFYTFNSYSGSMMITFKRDLENNITSFVYRDYDGDQREVFEFKKQ